MIDRSRVRHRRATPAGTAGRSGPRSSVVALVLAMVVSACGVFSNDRITADSAPVGGSSASSLVNDTVGSDVTAPPPALDPTFVAIADRTSMTEEARGLLASSAPQLVDKQALRVSCTVEPELSVLGCYHQGAITVLAIDDPRLDGMVETTTAHEMLHAAWVGLDETERSRLGALLLAAYERVVTEDLQERIEAYRSRDPTIVENELHSILGTEVGDLGAELEAYYGRWFTDRPAVVALAGTAQQTFAALEGQVGELDGRLAALLVDVEESQAAIDTNRALLDEEGARLNQLREEGLIADYNAGVEPYNQAVAAYNQAVADHEALVEGYNTLVRERNDLAAAYTDLVEQVDTSAEAVPEAG